MSEPPDFRLEQSELRSEDEFDEFGYEDLEYFVDFRGTFDKLPLCPDDESLAASGADVAIVGAPTDDGTSGRPGARFGPRAIRSAPTTWGRDAWSIQLEVEPYARLKRRRRGGRTRRPVAPRPGLRVIHEKVLRVASSGAIPFVLGGDHSITYPSAAAVARHVWPRKVGVVHFDAHADAANSVGGSLISHGTPMRRLIEEGWVEGRNFVQVGLRGYWPEKATFDWMRGAGVPLAHDRRDRGARGRRGDRRRDRRGARRSGPRLPLGGHRRRRPRRWLPERGRPNRAACRPASCCGRSAGSSGAVDLAGMDVVEVSPPYDQSEVTAILAYRVVMEALSALAAGRG